MSSHDVPPHGGQQVQDFLTKPLHDEDKAFRRHSAVSQQVSWWECHVFIQELLAKCNGDLPAAGTPEWCRLVDGDPRKLLSMAAAGEHHVLRVETAQEATAEASRAISEAADWPKAAREVQQRSNFYRTRPWLKRVRQ